MGLYYRTNMFFFSFFFNSFPFVYPPMFPLEEKKKGPGKSLGEDRGKIIVIRTAICEVGLVFVGFVNAVGATLGWCCRSALVVKEGLPYLYRGHFILSIYRYFRVTKSGLTTVSE